MYFLGINAKRKLNTSCIYIRIYKHSIAKSAFIPVPQHYTLLGIKCFQQMKTFFI